MASEDEQVSTSVLDGKAIAGDVRRQVAEEIATLKSKYPCFQPKLVIIQVTYIYALFNLALFLPHRLVTGVILMCTFV